MRTIFTESERSVLAEASGTALKKAAVKAMRLYIGSEGYVRMSDQQKLYNAAMLRVQKLADAFNMDAGDVWDQVNAEAQRQGALRPRPGQHV
jgi:hypothetical protein